MSVWLDFKGIIFAVAKFMPNLGKTKAKGGKSQENFNLSLLVPIERCQFAVPELWLGVFPPAGADRLAARCTVREFASGSF